METNKIICAGWVGRFGNRCHSYLYGKHIEDKFGHKFYVSSKWEGSVLFKNPAPVTPTNFTKNRFVYAGGSVNTDGFKQNTTKLNEYNKEHSDSIKLVDPFIESTYGTPNIAYISLVSDADWFFRKVRLTELRSYFEFTTEVKNSEVYQELIKEKGTYDIAHFRRTDISGKHYSGGHSMVSKKSYHDAFKKYNTNENDMVWVSDEPSIGWNWKGAIPEISGVKIPWLPDFLKLIFARRIFRSNSSFSVWAGWLSDAEIFAPWLHEYSPGKEVDFDFVRGNHPHWMSVKGKHSAYEFGIIDDVKKPKVEIPPQPPKKNDKLAMVHWNGRFGNRVFSYMFGRHYADKFDMDFYLPSEWEGTRLFADRGYKIIEDDQLRLEINQTTRELDNITARKRAVDAYNKRTGDTLKYFNPESPNDYGKRDVFFDSLCAHSSHLFRNYSKQKILKWLEFSDEVKNLDVYKRLEDRQGTYDIAHLRRDDISNANYNKNHPQGYSVVAKDSYLAAFKKYGYDVNQIEWTTDDWTGKWGVGKPTIRGGWQYPVGSKEVPDMMFDWLPDFLRLYFARTIFRGNSSFSWVAGFLSPCAKVYSPILTQRKTYCSENDELQFPFAEGNEPHWMALSNSNCPLIEIR